MSAHVGSTGASPAAPLLGARVPRALPSRIVLLGHPVAHSLSPAMQGAALRAAGLALTYEALDVAPHALRAMLDALVAEGAAGNVTIPHKAAVLARCDRVTSLAARVGAVNTFRVADGLLVGDNTDVGGFDATVRTLLGDTPRGQRVAVLGAGGSASAVLAAVESWADGSARVWSRTPERATELASRFVSIARAAASLDDALREATLVVNATPLGLVDDALPVVLDALPPGAAVVDLVYRGGETAWVRAARAAGHRAIDGLPMLVEQGALAFERWLGIAPDREAMWRAVGGRPEGARTVR